MRVIIAGGRYYDSVRADGLVANAMRTVAKRSPAVRPNVVLCGGATGIDSAAARWAAARGIPVERHPADWQRHGRAAGPLRNAEMAEVADALVLIWNGVSRGSASMKREAERRGVPVHEFILEGVGFIRRAGDAA